MRFLFHALITIVLLGVFIAAVLYTAGRDGFSARVAPGRAEEFFSTRVRKLAVPSGAREQSNPFRNEPNAWREAADHFEEHCALCHGSDGRGRSEIGRNLYPKAPDFTQPRTQQLADGEIYYIISNGVRFTGMPGWGGEDSPEEIWKLVSFIRHLPRLTPQEMEELDKARQGAEPQSESETGTRTKPAASSSAPRVKRPHQHQHGASPRPPQ